MARLSYPVLILCLFLVPNVQSRGEDLRSSTEEIFREAGLDQHMDDIDRRYKERFRETQIHLMFTYKKEMPLRRPDMNEA